MTWRPIRPPGRSARRTASKKARGTPRRPPRASRSTRPRRRCPRCRGSRAAGCRRGRSSPAAATRSRGEVVLRLRDRDRGHAAAQLAGGVEREAAPARADLQDVLARPRPASSAMRRYLSRWASSSDWSARLEDRARVGHRLVEEEPVEVVAEVVVGGDVAAAPLRVFRRARWATVRGSWSGTRHQPCVSASAERFSAASSAARRGPGDDHRPSTYASPAPVSPWSRMRTAAASSWMWISAAPLGRRVAEGPPAPSGRTTVSRPTRIRAAAARPSRPAMAGSARADRPKRAGVGPYRHRATSVWPSARATRAVPLESDAAAPEAQGVPVDEGDRLVGHERVAQQHPHDHRSVAGGDAGRGWWPGAGLALPLVDGDAQAAGRVVDVDGVAALHVDERRDVELLAIDERNGPFVADGRSV